MNTLLRIYVVSEEPLSIEAPQAHIEPCWRITRRGNSSTPILQLLRQAHSDLCWTNRHQQQDDVIEAVTAGCYNMLLFGTINGPIVFAIYKVWKCCSESSCDYCSGTVSWRLLQFVSQWRTAVTCVCVCVCVRLLWSEFVLYSAALTHSALYLFLSQGSDDESYVSDVSDNISEDNASVTDNVSRQSRSNPAPSRAGVRHL